MIILGLDIASVTGFAWYEPGSSLSSIKTGLIKATGENAEEKAASLAVQLVAMFKQGRPDFVAIETPMRNIVSFKKKRQDFGGEVEEQTINPNALQLSSLAGAAVAIIAAYRIQWECIPSQTWRKVFLGAGRMPGRDRAGWKRAAIDRCRMLRIEVKSADAAEAVGLSIAAASCQKFKMMQMRARDHAA